MLHFDIYGMLSQTIPFAKVELYEITFNYGFDMISKFFCIFSFYIWGISIAFLVHELGGYLGRYNWSTLAPSQPFYPMSFRFLLWNIWSPLPCDQRTQTHRLNIAGIWVWYRDLRIVTSWQSFSISIYFKSLVISVELRKKNRGSFTIMIIHRYAQECANSIMTT